MLIREAALEFLLIPTRRLPGIEDPLVGTAALPNYWHDATPRDHSRLAFVGAGIRPRRVESGESIALARPRTVRDHKGRHIAGA